MLKNIISHEILKNPLLALRQKEVFLALKKHWLGNHENLSRPEKFVEEFFDFLKKESLQDEVSEKKIKKFYHRKLAEYWDENLSKQKPKDMFFEIVEDELQDAKIILDFGCGKLAFLKEIAKNNQTVERLVGIDPKSQPIMENIDPRIEFGRSLDEVESSSADVAIVKLVLHHLNDAQEAQTIFSRLGRVLRPGGRLIIFEESFPDGACDISEVEKYLANFKLEMSEVTADFLKLSRESKANFLFLNDWLMNVQNAYMPWTGLYGSMEEWKELIEPSGFKEKEAHFLGAIKHRKRKQGMTAYLVFSKTF